jgi:hypothetical protein
MRQSCKPAKMLAIGVWIGCSIVHAVADEPPKSSLAEAAAGDQAEHQAKKLFDGKSLDGWRIIDKFDFANHGKVEVKAGEIILGRGDPATGIAWKGEMPRIDYEIRLEARRIDGRDFFCGITFPVGEAYLSLILGGWGGNVTGLSNVNGFAADENETTGYVEFKQNRWYKVRLRVAKEKIEAWVDDEQIVDLKTADRKFTIWWEQEPVRPFGIATWQTTGGLRNLQLKKL